MLAGIWIQQGYASGPAEIVVGTLNAAGPVAGVAYGHPRAWARGAAITAPAAAMMLAFSAVALSGVVILSRVHASETP